MPVSPRCAVALAVACTLVGARANANASGTPRALLSATLSRCVMFEDLTHEVCFKELLQGGSSASWREFMWLGGGSDGQGSGVARLCLSLRVPC